MKNTLEHEMIDYFSDAGSHLNYWALGFDAVMVTDTAHFRNPHYHTVGDTIETLNLDKMQYVVDTVVTAVVKMEY